MSALASKFAALSTDNAPGTEFGPHPRSIRLNFSQDRNVAVDATRRIVAMVERYKV
ncbi:hypothetical protein [Bosea sp. (in: a-proteobacteria)]|uniref:hypothetical protein n=1 Tax=Bosea sp. (in: a-proteobacteria) TaxID=1871050 RepID=UPI0031FE9358